MYSTVEMFELALPQRTSRTTLVLSNCDFREGTANVYFVYYTALNTTLVLKCCAALHGISRGWTIRSN